jgi:adhesin transport system membrane fusion protein
MTLSRSLIFLLASLISAGGYWASVTEIEVLTHATGKVVPTGKVRTVQNLEGGIIRSIFVKEGDAIKAHAKLLEFEGVASRSEVGELKSHIAFLTIESILINAEIKRLKPNVPEELANDFSEILSAGIDQISAKRKLLKSRLAVFDNEIEKRLSELTNNRKNIKEKTKTLNYIEQQIKISDDLLLERLTSELAHLDLLRSKQVVQGELDNIQQKTKNLKNEIKGFKLEITVANNSYDQELSKLYQDYNDQKNKFEQRLERFQDQLGRRIVLSPVDGVINKINSFTIGGVVKPGVDLIEIVPTSERLVIDADLPISDVGFVSTGQDVIIRLIGPNSMNYDFITGTVMKISPDTIQTDDGEDFYQVRISADKRQFSGVSGDYYLRTGLAVDCGLIVGKRTLLNNLLAPIIGSKNTLFTENVWADSKIDRS